MSEWKVVAEPQGNNPGSGTGEDGEEGQNTGGMVIFITNGTSKQEVSRVAWVRRNSKNPKTSFEKQFEKEVAKARASVEMLNEQFVGSGELQ